MFGVLVYVSFFSSCEIKIGNRVFRSHFSIHLLGVLRPEKHATLRVPAASLKRQRGRARAPGVRNSRKLRDEDQSRNA